jgi:lactate permease
MWIISAIPIVILLVLMVKFKWGAVKAAPMSLLVALITSLIFFKASFLLIFMESLKGIWNAFTVLIVIFPAILIYEVTDEAKAFVAFKNGLQAFTGNELLQILAIGWTFVSFLQGITGFGVPVAVGAPILVGIGVSPLWAVMITLLGHAWANTFGTLAVAWEALVMQANLLNSPILSMIALWAAVLLWLFNFVSGTMICWWYGGKEAAKKGLPAVLIISFIHGGGQLLFSQYNTALAAFVPASIALGVILLLGRLPIYRESWAIQESRVMKRDGIKVEDSNAEHMNLKRAFFPYFCLIAITLLILLIRPVNNYFNQIQFGFSFPETRTLYGYINEMVDVYSPIRPFTHAGMFLSLSAILGFLYFYRYKYIKISSWKRILKRSAEKTLPSAIGIIALVAMSKIMGGTGQILVLAKGTAILTSQYFASLAAFVGILGSFITSSNLASNILFGDFQQKTASILKLNEASILGAQTAGGAMGNTISPGNVLLGTTTTGIIGKEGIIIKMILPITLGIAAITGIILFIANFS